MRFFWGRTVPDHMVFRTEPNYRQGFEIIRMMTMYALCTAVLTASFYHAASPNSITELLPRPDLQCVLPSTFNQFLRMSLGPINGIGNAFSSMFQVMTTINFKTFGSIFCGPTFLRLICFGPVFFSVFSFAISTLCISPRLSVRFPDSKSIQGFFLLAFRTSFHVPIVAN